MLLFKKPESHDALAFNQAPEFLKDDINISDLLTVDRNIVEICIGGKKCRQLTVRKNLRQPKMAGVALFNCYMSIKSYGSGQYIGLYDKKLCLEKLKELIKMLTMIPRRIQVLVDDKGNVIDKCKQIELADDIYVAMKPTTKDLDEIAHQFGIKQFESFTLTFASEMETLDARKFQYVKDVKTYVQRNYKIIT